MDNAAFITLERITVRLRDRWYLEDTSWQIRRAEQWAILGPNGSGKTTLAKALAGEVPIVQGRRLLGDSWQDTAMTAGPSIAFVSAEQPAEVLRREALLAQSRSFAGQLDEVTRAREVLCQNLAPRQEIYPQPAQRMESACRRLHIAELLDRPIEALSSGELRKLLLVRAVLKQPQLLVLDEPFDNLDQGSKDAVAALITRLITEGLHIVLITHRIEEILPAVTHVLLLQEGRVKAKGPRHEILNQKDVNGLFETPLAPGLRWPDTPPGQGKPAAGPQPIALPDLKPQPSSLVEMDRVNVSYSSGPVLKDFSWTMRKGENWAILGPNGAGKSTILELICGDHLQAYANQIRLFGRPRGSGESIWEIKRHIGFISPEFHARYHKNISAFDVICSGFFDSVGLYRLCSAKQIRQAEQWVKSLNLSDLSPIPFQQLSYGQRQLILIGRAMVKSPLLLILDEPCEGLDKAHRCRLLAMLDTIGRRPGHHLIYVTHHKAELPGCITHILKLKEGRAVAAYAS